MADSTDRRRVNLITSIIRLFLDQIQSLEEEQIRIYRERAALLPNRHVENSDKEKVSATQRSCELCGDPVDHTPDKPREASDNPAKIRWWNVAPPGLSSRKQGDVISPLCINCADCLTICGFIGR